MFDARSAQRMLCKVIKAGKTVDTGGYMEVLRKKGGRSLIVRDTLELVDAARHLLRLLRRRNRCRG